MYILYVVCLKEVSGHGIYLYFVGLWGAAKAAYKTRSFVRGVDSQVSPTAIIIFHHYHKQLVRSGLWRRLGIVNYEITRYLGTVYRADVVLSSRVLLSWVGHLGTGCRIGE